MPALCWNDNDRASGRAASGTPTNGGAGDMCHGVGGKLGQEQMQIFFLSSLFPDAKKSDFEHFCVFVIMRSFSFFPNFFSPAYIPPIVEQKVHLSTLHIWALGSGGRLTLRVSVCFV